jgi:hypothetical protein
MPTAALIVMPDAAEPRLIFTVRHRRGRHSTVVMSANRKAFGEHRGLGAWAAWCE